MIIVQRTYTRPTIDTPWHDELVKKTPAEIRHIMEKYVYTNKRVERSFDTYDATGLVRTYKSKWISREAWDEYDNDPFLQEFWRQKEIYNNSVGIIMGDKEYINL